MVKAAWFRNYTQDELPAKFQRIVPRWDASNTTELSPHPNPPPHAGRGRVGCTSWGIQAKELYLLDVLRRRMEYPELSRAVRCGVSNCTSSRAERASATATGL